MNFKSLLKHLIAKIYDRIWQKNFRTKNGNTIHYILKRKKSKKLVIVFSGFSGHYVKGRFNYIHTLKTNSDNQLFIKDDDGFCGVGTYYLGEKCSKFQEDGILQLIDYVKTKCKIEKVIMTGSSKGGTASILYGLRYEADFIIAGSPQFKIASYLYNLDGEDYGKEVLNPIVDEESGYNFSKIDNLINDEIFSAKEKTTVYLYYSRKEPSWKRDVIALVDSLEESPIHFVGNDLSYEKHDDIGFFMKKNLVSILNKINQVDKR